MPLNWEKVKQKLQVPKDEDSYYDNTQWCNRDLIPIPRDRQTYGILSFFGYWVVSGACISAWSTGSTLLAFGLTPQQAIGVVAIGGILTGILAVVCGWMGEVHHIGFTVSSRFCWGMRGSYFPVILRAFSGSLWFGMQAFWGGQAMRVMLGAIFPSLAHLPNSFSEGSHLQTNDFIGFVVWMVIFIPTLLIRPEKLQIPFFICFLFFCGSCMGMLIWATSQAHGPGAMFHQPGTAPNLGWAFMFGITAILGAWGAGTLGQSDWTRYAERRFAPTLSQLVASPLTITITAMIGVIVTSASHDIIGGELIWNPIYLLAKIQDFYGGSSKARAGVFFASLGMVLSQFAISTVLNAVSCGMDLAGLWPRYINIRRGASIMAIIGVAAQPWQLISTATKFLAVLSGFGVFMAPATGILLSEYHLIRRQKLKLRDLYIGDASSIYWYRDGVNWRAFVSFVLGMWPLLPGMVATVNGYTEPQYVGWIRLYNLTFLVGLAITFTVHLSLNYFFPVPGLGEEGPFVDDFIDGSSDQQASLGQDEEKRGVETTKEL